MKARSKRIQIGTIQKIEDDRYFVILEDNRMVECTFSQKSKRYYTDNLPVENDKVQIELSPHDNSIGRIEPRGFVY